MTTPWSTMRCSEPGGSVVVAIIASRAPGRWFVRCIGVLHVKFRVEGLYEIDAQPVLLARRLEGSTFSLSHSTTPQLGGVRIRHFVEMVRRLKPDGSPDLDIFAFVLDDGRDKEKFSVGQIVDLES